MTRLQLFKNVLFTALVGLFGALTSCSLNSVVNLHDDNSADVQVTLAWQKPLEAYWSDLRELDATLPAHPLEAQTVRAALQAASQQKDSPLKDPLVSSQEREVKLSFHWTEQSLEGWGLSLTTTPQGERLNLKWNRQTLLRWLGTTTYAHSEALSALLPDPETTATDLANNLAYALGSYAKNSLALVQSSQVQIVLKLPRPVKSLTGKATYQGNTVTCRWPLTEFLTQGETLSVTY